MKSKFTLLLISMLISTLAIAQSNLIITEIQFDVPDDAAGDANGDGVRGSRSDEFVEFYNSGSEVIDLSAYQIIEREGIPVFTFPIGATVDPGQFVVVFGAVGPAGYGSNIPPETAFYQVQVTADDANVGFDNGLGKTNFSNSSDRVMLVNPLLADTLFEVFWGGDTAAGAQPIAPLTDQAIYLSAPNTISGDTISGRIKQSVTRDINGTQWDKHTIVTGDLEYLYSPGLNAEEYKGPTTADLFISEILFDVPADELGDANGDGVRGSRSDEFIEIYNPGPIDADLTGYQILDREGVAVYSFPDSAMLSIGQYAVVFGAVGSQGYGANIPPETAVFEVAQTDDNVGFDNGLGKSNFSRTGDAVLLVNSALADTVMEVYWGTALPHTAGAIYMAAPNTITGDTITGAIAQSITRKLNNELWDVHTVVSEDELSLFSPGTDAARSHVVFDTDIIISEIDFDVPPDPNGDINGDGVRGSRSDEFIEFYNKGESAVDLSGYQILESNSIPVFTFPSGATINPGQFVVVFGAVGPSGYGDNIPPEAGVYEVAVTTDDSNVGFDNGAGKTNFSQDGDCVVLVNPAASDTLYEVYWGTASPVSSKALYLAFPNTISGNSISGSIDQSVTHNINSTMWDIHTIVTEDETKLYSPGKNADSPVAVEDDKEIPVKFSLSQNYPNPFNPSTAIEFTLARKEFVSLKIFDILGREIITLVNQELNGGKYKYTWNAANAASGVYFYKLSGSTSVLTKKMILIK